MPIRYSPSEAKILLAAYNKSLDPTIQVLSGGGSIKEIKE